jgi:hypothetical protein
VSKAVKKGVMHHSVICLAPVKEEKAGEIAPLYPRSHSGIESEEGISRSAPMPEAVLMIIQWDVRAQPVQQQVCE